jgi:transposase
VIGLPSLGDLDRGRPSEIPRIWLALSPTDMRCGFGRLAELAASALGGDPRSGHLFVFRSRGDDLLKFLCWDLDGMALRCDRMKTRTLPPERCGEGFAISRWCRRIRRH